MSRPPKLIQKHLQSSLKSLIDWSDSLKIKTKTNKTHYLTFKNPSKKKSSIELNVKGLSTQNTQPIKFLGIILSPHLKWNELCKDLVRRANSRLFQLWKLSKLIFNRESLILVNKYWIRTLFLYSNDCWLDHCYSLINKKQNRSKSSPANVPLKTKMVPDLKTPRRGKNEVNQQNAE